MIKEGGENSEFEKTNLLSRYCILLRKFHSGVHKLDI